ncbi:MAG TPA: N-succinylarginine dihydrolase [Planctomycetota bacterium]|nr:N-succinylarginine dihydrolase [Planctomycetota bacterium]
MDDPLVEVQVDGLPGPTHHFGGLSAGNLASLAHAGFSSRPRAAARQGLAKMRQVLALGVPQAWLPPLPRPDVALLRSAGFHGSDAEVLRAAAADLHLLHVAISSAFMWTANCATVIPASDSADGRCHVIAANLIAMSHRAREGALRAAQLRTMLAGIDDVVVHDPLPALNDLGDEGAANHSRVWAPGTPAVHLFVHGRAGGERLTTRLPARQTREAGVAVARIAALPPEQVMHLRQNPAAIDAGAFHNDVVMVGDGARLLLHAEAWVDQPAVLADLRRRIPGFQVAEIASTDLTLSQAVASYLFNSQLLTTPHGVVLVAPAQAGEGRAGIVVRRLIDDGFIDRAQFLDLGESMANGGGPACLRLRLPLRRKSLARLAQGMLLDDAGITALEGWVDRHYREILTPEDVADPRLLSEWASAEVELKTLMIRADRT